MFKVKSVFLTLCLISQTAIADGGAPALDIRALKLDNTLSECVAVALKDVQQTRFGTFINATLSNRQSAGKCGCKSAVLSYSVIEIADSPQAPKDVDASEWTRVYVTFMPFKAGEKSGAKKDIAFMLQSTNGSTNSKHKPVLRLSCASSP